MSDPSGSGRVDVLTSPVAAERAAVATEAWVKSKHDMYLIRGFRRVFTHPPEDKKNKNKTKTSTQVLLCTTTSTCSVFQGTTFFAARYSYYKSHRVSWAELREDIHRRRAFRRTTRMSEGKLVKFAHQLRPALPKKEVKPWHDTTYYLVPDVRVPGTCCVPYVFLCISRRHILRPAPRRELSQRWVGMVSHLQ